MKRKILSLALALMMIVSVAAALPVSAEVVDDIILDVVANDTAAEGVSYLGTLETAYQPISGPSWVTKGCIIMNTSSTHITFTFNVDVAGAYDVYIAHGSDAEKNLNVFTGENTDIQIAKSVTAAVNPEATKSHILYPVESKLAVNVPFTKGENKLKIAGGAGAVYNIRLVYKSATDSVYIGWSGTGTLGGHGNSASGTSDEVDWAFDTSNGFLVGPNTDMSYPVTVFESGYYKIKTAAKVYNATLGKIDIYDGENLIADNMQVVNSGSTIVDICSSNFVWLDAGVRTIRIDSAGGYAYFHGFKLEKYTLTNDDLGVIIPVGSGTGTAGDYAPANTGAPSDDLGWIPAGYQLLGAKTDYTYTVNILKDGYYDIYMAASLYNSKMGLSIDFYDGDNVLAYNCQAGDIVSTSITDPGEAVVASAWFTKGTHTLRIDGRTGNNWVYGFKLEYTGSEKTKFIYDAASPSGMGKSYALGNYGINNIEWCDYGTTNLYEAGYLEYDLYITDAGYYTVTLALNSTAGTCRVQIDGTEIATNASINVNSGSLTTADAVAGTIDVAKAYIKEGSHKLKIMPPEVSASACLIYNIKVEKDATQPEADAVRIAGRNGAALADGIFAETAAFAEVKTSDNAKLFVVTYEAMSDGSMKMSEIAPGAVLATDGDVKIIRTSLLSTKAGEVKAFFWKDGTFIPVDSATVTVASKPVEPEVAE